MTLQPVLLSRQRTAGGSGVGRAGGFDEKDLRLLVGQRAVLDAAGDDEEVALVKLDVAVAQVDRQGPVEHEEEIVGLVVLVPDEPPLDLDDLDVVVVQASDDLRTPGIDEGLELLGQVDLVLHSLSPFCAIVVERRELEGWARGVFRRGQFVAGRAVTRPVSYAMTTSCARSRAPSLSRMRLTWVFAVAGLITSRSASSSLRRPAATRASTSRSRSVSSPSSAGEWRCGAGLEMNSEINRRVTLGDSNASPAATTRTASRRSSGSTSLSRKPLAPACNASNTYSSRSKVVSMITRTSASFRSEAIRRVASRPSTSGMRMSIRTMSGWSARARSTASAPVEASPTTSMSSARSSSIRKPERTSAWSSASSTRMLTRAPSGSADGRAPENRHRERLRRRSCRRPLPLALASRSGHARLLPPRLRYPAPARRPPPRARARRARSGSARSLRMPPR